MGFLFLLSFYMLMGFVKGCKEMDNGDLGRDAILDTNQMEETGQCGGTHMIDNSMEQRMNEMFESDDLNFVDLREKIANVLKHPIFMEFLDDSDPNVYETIESAACGSEQLIEMPNIQHDVGGVCV